MKNKFKMFLMVFLIVMLGCFTSVFADTTNDGVEIGTANLNNTTDNSAEVGNVLKKPEVGWTRYDDSNSKIKYIGGDWLYSSRYPTQTYKGDYHQLKNNSCDESCIFKFRGTQIRLIGTLYSVYPQYAYITIDNNPEEAFIINSSKEARFQSLLYSKIGLENTVHTIKITQKANRGVGIFIDAIDIDSTGCLIDPSETLATGISLNKVSDSLAVGQTDTLKAIVTPDSTTNKNVNWGSSDSSIATVDSTGKVTALKEGTVTITATTTDGSHLSASCVLTIVKKEILIINIMDGSKKQYYLSEDELNAFINWYYARANNQTNIPYYIFVVPPTDSSPAKKDYIPFSTIGSFEVE